MALCRCTENDHGNIKAVKGKYVGHAEPLGYPETSSICGRANCRKPGLIWLTNEEYAAWKKGEIIFSLDTSAIKVRVKPCNRE